jgi:hypothetical protein
VTKFGSEVQFWGKLRRVTEERQHPRYPRSRETWKLWVPVDYPTRMGVYLGLRSIQDGVRHYDEDVGYYFETRERQTVALVCPGPGKNPIYVPLECMRVIDPNQLELEIA